MLYGSDACCLRENDMTILRRTKKATIREMDGAKLIEKSSQQLTELLGLEGTLDRMRKANGVQWYGHVLRRYGNDVLRRALGFELVERR